MAANAATGAVGAIHSVEVTQTGSLPLPPLDPSLTDDIVASGDIVKWAASYQVSTPGTYTLTATAPVGSRFSESSISLGEPKGSSISEDGRTAVLQLTADTAESNVWALEATVSGANGGEAAISVSAEGGATAKSAPTKIVATPAYDIDALGHGTGPVTLDGVNGVEMRYNYGVFVPYDAAIQTRGHEPLRAKDSLSFDLDLSALPDGVRASAQNSPIHFSSPFPGSSGGAANSVTNSGTQRVVVDEAAKTARVTISGADTTAQHVPTISSAGGAIPGDRAYVITHSIKLWVPSTNVPENTSRQPIGISNLEIHSLSDSPNSITPAQIQPTVTINNASGGGFSGRYMIQEVGGAALPGWESPQTSGGPLYPGQPIEYRLQLNNDNPLGLERSDSRGAIVLTGDGQAPTGDLELFGTAFTFKDVEYGTLVYPDDAARAADQGEPGDGTPGWYKTRRDAEAAGTISAVRFSINENIPATQYARLLWPITVGESAGQTGQKIGFLGQHFSTGMARPASSERYGSSFNSQLRVDISGAEGKNVGPAGTREVVLKTSVLNEYIPGAQVSDKDVSVKVVLPPSVSYQGGSASQNPSNAETDAEGTTTLTFTFAELTSADSDAITFNVVANPNAAMPETVNLSAEIASATNAEPASVRTGTDFFYINAPSNFGYELSESTRVIEPGDEITYNLAGFNTLATSVGEFTAVSVLPYDGDINGSTGIKTTLRSMEIADTLRAWITADDAASVRTAVQSDVNSTAVTWIAFTPGMDGLEKATAIKFQKPTLNAGESVSAKYIVSAELLGQPQKAVVKNSLTAVSASAIASGSISKDVAGVSADLVQSSLTGIAYRDDNFNGKHDASDKKVASAVATLSGYSFGPDGIDSGGNGDDVAVPAGVTVTTDNSGKFIFAGLHSGRYSVSVDAPAGFETNGDVLSEVVVASDTEVISTSNIGFVDSSALPVAANDSVRIADAKATLDVVSGTTGGLVADAGTDIKLNPKHTPVVAPQGAATASYEGGKLMLTPKITWADAETSRVVTVTYEIIGVLGKTSTAQVEAVVQRAPVNTGDTTLPTLARSGAQATTTVSVATLNAAALSTVAVKTQPAGDPEVTVTGDQLLVDSKGAAAGDYSFVLTLTDDLGQKTDVTYTFSVQAAPTGAAQDLGKVAVGQSLAPFTPEVSGVGVTSAQSADPAPSKGTVAFDADGRITYTAQDVGGKDTFSVTYVDNLDQSVVVVYTVEVVEGITVAPVEAQRVALSGTTVFSNVIGIPTGNSLIASELTAEAATLGTATVSADGTSVSYVAGDSAGTDTFSVLFTGAFGAPVTVTYEVLIQELPTATAGSATVVEKGTSSYNAAPVSPGGLAVTEARVTGFPDSVSFSADPSGEVTFDAKDNTAGTFSAQVSFRDELGQWSVPVTYTVTVQTKPAAADLSAVIGVGKAHTFTTGVTGTAVSAAVTQQPTTGTVVVSADGATVSYTAASTDGAMSFTVTYTDDLGQSTEAQYRVVVQAAPAVSGDTSLILGEDQSAAFDASLSTEAGLASARVTGALPDGLSVDIDPVTGTVTVHSGDAAAGEHRFTVTYTDTHGNTSDVEYTVTVQAKPVINDGLPVETIVPQNGEVQLDEVMSSTGSILTREVISAPAAGSVRLASVHYNAEGAEAGTYGFTVRYTDDLGQSVDAEYLPTVQPAPSGIGRTVTVNYGTEQIALDPIADANGTNLIPLTDSDISRVSAGSARVADALVVFSPPAETSGSYTLSVQVSDDLGQSVVLDYTVIVTEAKVVAEESDNSLAITGAQIGGALGVMALLLGAGAVLLFLRRRRAEQE
ncbi:putative Ig domain-containing protein [Mycetocola spongiae]|uniref:putative Ig domain-containing protein n=1 Tax=Mycetocola spongiae TaxID=2859226 RepID=UPI001CF35405|nr:putative Ig domain-containing protein [Mycetocola spongiae]UCR88836.1 hypothetical protein KXZ72_12920 [Mycetocola spongiae]